MFAMKNKVIFFLGVEDLWDPTSFWNGISIHYQVITKEPSFGDADLILYMSVKQIPFCLTVSGMLIIIDRKGI